MNTSAHIRMLLHTVYLIVAAILCYGNSSGAVADTSYIDEQILLIKKLKYEDPQHAMRLTDTLLQIARQLNNEKRIAMCYVSRGTIYDDLGEYDKAFGCYDTALAINLKLNYKKGIAHVYNNKGIIYNKQGRMDAGLASHLQALKYRQELNDSAGIASSMGNIGLIYSKLKQQKKAINYISESIRLKLLLHETEENLARWYNGLAMAYDDDEQDERALEYYTKAIKASESAGDEHNLGYVYGNIGTYYHEHKNYSTALAYMLKAYKVLKHIDERDALAINTSSIAGLLNELGRPEEALVYAQESLQLSDSLKSFDYRARAHRFVAEAYALTGNSELANKHYLDALSLKDSMYNENTADATAAMEAKYKNEIKEKEIKELKQENEIRQLTIDARTATLAKTRYVAAILVLVLIGIAVTFYVTVERLKIKQQLRMALEREQLQKDGIAAVIQAQEEERKRIARDLHDNVCQQLGAIRISMQHGSAANIPAIKMLDDTTSEVRNISYQMLPVTLQHYGLSPALEELVRHTFANTNIDAQFEDLGVNVPVNEQIQLTVYRVAQELAANVLKHSKANRVMMQQYLSKNNLMLVVEDNGKGMDEMNNVTGMGLLNIRTRIAQAGGELVMERSTEQGLRTVVKIPLTT